MINLFLVREQVSREKVVTDRHGNQGYLGKMYLNGVIFDTIERAQGYVRLPPGAYQLQMYRSARLGNVLRPLTSSGAELAGKKNKIRIHAGANPSDVQGCIAPGFRGASAAGIPLHGSRTALEFILSVCGPWENLRLVGNFFVLENHVPPTAKHTAHLLEMGNAFSLHSLCVGL